MATTTATVSIYSSDLQPGNRLSINATSTLMKTGLTTGLTLVDMGRGELTATSQEDALHEALGTEDSANWVYICNASTDDQQYMEIALKDTVLGYLGAGDWTFFPWNMGNADQELEIEAEASGTIPYEWAIFKSAPYTLPAAG